MRTRAFFVLMFAWVLWSNTGSAFNGGNYWEADNGFETRAQCMTEREWRITHLPANMNAKAALNGWSFDGVNGERFVTTFVCLPDTVDPRPPVAAH